MEESTSKGDSTQSFRIGRGAENDGRDGTGSEEGADVSGRGLMDVAIERAFFLRSLEATMNPSFLVVLEVGELVPTPTFGLDTCSTDLLIIPSGLSSSSSSSSSCFFFGSCSIGALSFSPGPRSSSAALFKSSSAIELFLRLNAPADIFRSSRPPSSASSSSSGAKTE